jgi:tetratricopeptide (TPR) repeat protein
MTRPTLLQLLAHPATLTGADVHELEQLALAFPYCQTAHLLLAKAAHDQGSMLASQRLRRAATYATDRTLLRQLIEAKPTPVAELELVAAEEAVSVEAAEAATPTLAAPVALLPPPVEDQGGDIVEPATPTLVTEVCQDEPEAVGARDTTTPSLVVEAAEVETATTDLPQPEPPANDVLPEDELPAQAPPIRPPAEAEAARFEFGLAEAEPAEIMAYRLPELEEAPVAAPKLTEALPPFSGVADVGYAPGEGSRLGFCLQSQEAVVYSLTTGPAALLPSTVLPPASEFFAPDALLLAHLAAHQEAADTTPTPAAKDLINSFLQRTPLAAARRRATLPAFDAEQEEQPDLSGRSTQVVPDLASENLAKILARQGKTDRAIAIYERLMVKQPEKMAYFAAQIDSLRPSA